MDIAAVGLLRPHRTFIPADLEREPPEQTAAARARAPTGLRVQMNGTEYVGISDRARTPVSVSARGTRRRRGEESHGLLESPLTVPGFASTLATRHSGVTMHRDESVLALQHHVRVGPFE